MATTAGAWEGASLQVQMCGVGGAPRGKGQGTAQAGKAKATEGFSRDWGVGARALALPCHAQPRLLRLYPGYPALFHSPQPRPRACH